MTEDEWNSSDDVFEMLSFLGRTDIADSNRKLRLFSCAYARLLLPHLPDPEFRTAIDVGERFADGKADEAERFEANFRASAVIGRYARKQDPTPSEMFRQHAKFCVMVERAPLTAKWLYSYYRPLPLLHQSFTGPLAAQHAGLLREVFGPLPFRPVRVESRWLTPEVIGAAETIYRNREFERMPELGRLLSDSGCDSTEILDHCERGGPHVRGCWVIDLLLNRPW